MRKQNVYLPLEDDTLITLDRLWEQMVEKERCAAIAQAMRALPDEDREIFYRFYDLSQTAAQIAEDLHLNASTVRSRLMRGRRTLREALEKEVCFVKTTWDELMRYAPEQEIPLPPMQDGEGARILSKTMGKIKETKQKPARPVRTVLIAAAIAALCAAVRLRRTPSAGSTGCSAKKPRWSRTMSRAMTKKRLQSSHSRRTPRKSRP